MRVVSLIALAFLLPGKATAPLLHAETAAELAACSGLQMASQNGYGFARCCSRNTLGLIPLSFLKKWLK